MEKLNKKTFRALDQEENELMDSIERGEWQSAYWGQTKLIY